MKHIFLTGATGLVGEYLIRDLLLAGARLAVLIRSREKEPASRRLGKILARWQQELGKPLPRPICLEGDVTREGMGLTREARDWVSRNCDRVLHNAASLTFVGADRNGEPWRTNLTGTANLLAFCRQAGLNQFHYVSTAYACGKRDGVVCEEDLDCDVGFRNDYEHSKCEAEKLVRAADFLKDTTIYRPAVIVGDSRTGYTATYHGLYSYLHVVWMLSKYVSPGEDGRAYYPMRLNWNPDEPRNLVTVDWVSAVIAHLVLSPEHHGRTYHLTPDVPVTAGGLEPLLADYFQYHGTTFVQRDTLSATDLTEREKAFYENVETYEPYSEKEPVFDKRNTRAAAANLPCPPIDRACLFRLIDFAVRDNWGRSGAQVTEE